MPAIAMPFLTIPDELVKAGPWILTFAGKQIEKPELLAGWDYAADLKVERSIELDIKKICEILRISEMVLELELVALWGTGGANKPENVEIIGRETILARESNTRLVIRGDLIGNRLSRQLFLDTAIVLKTAPPGASGITPHISLARLWQDNLKVRLEGEVNRFPIQTASLSASFGENHLAGRSLWYLEQDSGMPELPLHGNVRLHLNDDHPEFVRSISEGDNILLQAVMTDVISQMMEPVLLSEDLTDRVFACEDKDSVGHQIEQWINDIFGSREAALQELQIHPSRFRATINGFAEIGETA